jgi:hypothetical protein
MFWRNYVGRNYIVQVLSSVSLIDFKGLVKFYFLDGPRL